MSGPPGSFFSIIRRNSRVFLSRIVGSVSSGQVARWYGMEGDRFGIPSPTRVVVHVPTNPSEVTNQVSSLTVCVPTVPTVVLFWSLAVSRSQHNCMRPFFDLSNPFGRSCAAHPDPGSVPVTSSSHPPYLLPSWMAWCRIPAPNRSLSLPRREYLLQNGFLSLPLGEFFPLPSLRGRRRV